MEAFQLAADRLVFDPCWAVRLGAEPPLAVGLIGLVIALEPFDMAVAFEGQDMRRDPVEEPAVVADDDGAPAKSSSASSSARRASTSRSSVGSPAEEVGAALQHPRQMDLVQPATRQLLDAFRWSPPRN